MAFEHDITRRNDLPDSDDPVRRIAALEESLRGYEALSVRLRRQTEALTRTLGTLTREPGPGTMVEQVLLASSGAMGAPYAALWRCDGVDAAGELTRICDNGQVTAVRAGESPPPHPFAAVEETLWSRIRESLGPVALEAFDGAESAVRAAVAVPLMLGDEVVGWIAVGYPEPRAFHSAERELAAVMALEVALAVQMTALMEKCRTAAVLDERNRMAREIHDTLAQGFTGIVIQLDVAEMLLAQEPDAAAEHLTAARVLARDSLSEARRSVWALRPSALEHAGLAAALESLAHQMAAGSTTAVSFEIEGDPVPAPPDIEANLLRIGLESLTNALKHAAASRVRIVLRYTSRGVRLSVRDDGCGFELERAGAFGGFGLTSMRERAQSIGGELSVRSRPGHGCEVVAAATFRRPPKGRVPSG